MNRASPRSTLFPYTTLFRSLRYTEEHGGITLREPASRLPDARHELSAKQEVLGLLAVEADVREDVAAAPSHLDFSHQRRSLSRGRKSTRLNSSHPSISYAVF